MTRDYSRFLPSATKAGTSKPERSTLERLGWQPFFAQQLSLEDLNEFPPVRVVEVHRNGLHVLGDDVDILVPPNLEATVGDWLLLDRQRPSHSRVLDRKSLFKRRAPGKERKLQLIAANVDTLGIVTACNGDFNLARIERYVALAASAGCLPLLILTHADQVDDPAEYCRKALALTPLLAAVTLDARDESQIDRLHPWCRDGQTLALAGSSGVGKTTLPNALTASADKTQGIREDDAKGRHTTTARMLRPTRAGGWLIDTPGMRELGLSEASDGIGAVFPDLDEAAARCRFANCQHQGDAGCAIAAGLQTGLFDEDQVARWQKLRREDARNSESAQERRQRARAQQKIYAQGQRRGRRKRGGRD